MFKNTYRIVSDNYLGFEAQHKYWWFPFIWWQIPGVGPINTFSSVEQAEKFIHKTKFIKEVV